jgi:hypothetical protein
MTRVRQKILKLGDIIEISVQCIGGGISLHQQVVFEFLYGLFHLITLYLSIVSKYLTTGGKSSHAHGCSLPETMGLMCLEKIKNRGFTRVRVGALPSIILLFIFGLITFFSAQNDFYINMKVCRELSLIGRTIFDVKSFSLLY